MLAILNKMRQILAAIVVGSGLVFSGPALAQESTDCTRLNDLVKSALADQVRPHINQFKSLNITLPTAIVGDDAKVCLPHNYETSFGIFKVTEVTIDYYVEGHEWYHIEKID